MRIQFAVALGLLTSVPVLATSRTINLTVAGSSSTNYEAFVGSTSNNTNAGIAGTIALTIDYSNPPDQCPTPTAYAFSTNALTASPVLIDVAWIDGTYRYSLPSTGGNLSGSGSVTGTELDVSAASLQVTSGTVTESGTGTGAGYSRTTDFSSSSKTYPLGEGALTVTETYSSCRDGYCSKHCKFDLEVSFNGNEHLWSSPSSVDLDFHGSVYASGTSAF